MNMTLHKLILNTLAAFVLTAGLLLNETYAADRKAPPTRQVAEPEKKISTLISDDDRMGWLIAPSLGFSTISNNTGLLLGGKGGVILNHTLVLGAAGYVYLPDTFGNTAIGNTDLGYGGAYVEYIFSPRELYHFSISTVLGGGTANADTVFVATPAVNGILNLSETVHLGLEVSYRLVSALSNNSQNLDRFSSPAFSLFFQLGSF